MSDTKIFMPVIVLILFLFAFAMFMAGFTYGIPHGMQNKEKEAVVKGHATWVADKDGNSTFQWGESCK
jgi:uncharacterized ion transporter superfamily protein YfcC